jgi:ribosomal protein L37AE/L43A
MGGIVPVQAHICPCCRTVLKQPQQMAYVWRCSNCGYYSGTRDKSIGHEPSAAELAEEFLPKLVVE